jgi:hypothetical protein
MFRSLAIAAAISFGFIPPHAQAGRVNPQWEYVQPHCGSNGCVRGYHRTVTNGTKCDNYSTSGNVNPWTGQPGTKSASPEKCE